MGMAASQARFLGLTARKSNVEYQGQQVNQQRTALSNESANLYNQMMALDVPTPPATTDFYTTTYELENSSGNNNTVTGNYSFQNAIKTYNENNANEYNVTLINKKGYISAVPKTYQLGTVEEKTELKMITSPTTAVAGDKFDGKYYLQKVSYIDETKDKSTHYIIADPEKALGKTKSSSTDYTYALYPNAKMKDDNSDVAIVAATTKVKNDQNQEVDKTTYYNIKTGEEIAADKLTLGERADDPDNDDDVKIVNSKNTVPDSENQVSYKILTNTITVDSTSTTLTYNEQDLDAYDSSGQLAVESYQIYKVDPYKTLQGKDTCCKNGGEGYYFYQDKQGNNHFFTEDELQDFLCKTSDKEFYETYANSYDKEFQVQVTGVMEKSSTGRFSTLKIYDDSTYPTELRNITFALNCKQEFDQEGYDNAMNDYNYQKDVYEKVVSDINSKTKIIQGQDQKLELRLDQLDTEQNAIKTEMDAVTKVLKDNVEKTFKTFNA